MKLIALKQIKVEFLMFRGDGSKIFLRRGCTIKKMNSTSSHVFLFVCLFDYFAEREPQVISGWGGGGGAAHTCTAPLDSPLGYYLQQGTLEGKVKCYVSQISIRTPTSFPRLFP